MSPALRAARVRISDLESEVAAMKPLYELGKTITESISLGAVFQGFITSVTIESDAVGGPFAHSVLRSYQVYVTTQGYGLGGLPKKAILFAVPEGR